MHSGEFDVTIYAATLEIVHDGKVAWQQTSTNIPYMLTLNRGENVAQKLAEASKGPGYGFYTHLKLPEFVQKPSDVSGGSRPSSNQSLGISRVTASGIR